MRQPLKISSDEFERDVQRYQDLAKTQPIAVTRNGRGQTILISIEEYERLKRRDREVLGLEDFTAEDIAAIAASEASESAKAFDHEFEG